MQKDPFTNLFINICMWKRTFTPNNDCLKIDVFNEPFSTQNIKNMALLYLIERFLHFETILDAKYYLQC